MVFKYSSLNAGPDPEHMPGCYLDSASAFEKGEIPLDEFLRRCLRHLGSSEKADHEKHDVLDGLGCLAWRYYETFGTVAAAIKLCESDPRAQAIDGEKLLSVFMACTSKDSSMKSIQFISNNSLGADSDAALAIPLIRQALIVTAIQSEHWSLVEELIQVDCTPPPPEDKCMFTMRGSPIAQGVPEIDVPARVWTPLIAVGWVPGTFSTAMIGSQCTNAAEGIALLKATQAGGFDLTDRKLGWGERLQDSAIAVGAPEVVKYLRDLCLITKPLKNDTLQSVVQSRKTGGVDMLRWLIDEFGLDVNWKGAADPNGYANYDPRERAQAGWYDAKSALHWAANNGNTEAVRFLLERGADPSLGDAQGLTARKLAAGAGHTAVVEVIDEHQHHG